MRQQPAGEAGGGLRGVAESVDIGQQTGLFGADMFGKVMDILEEEIPEIGWCDS